MKSLGKMTNEELLKELRDIWVYVSNDSVCIRRYNMLECEILNRMNGCKPKESD